jgi:hypothetical protein
MSADEKEELLDLLAWAFNEAQGWLGDSRGCDYSEAPYKDDRAERILEILGENGKSLDVFDN